MSRSNWRPDIALGRRLLGAVFVILALVVLIPAFSKPSAHAQGGNKRDGAGDQQGKNYTPIPSFKVQSKSGVYLADCANPKDHDQADLCEQMKMAYAAKESLQINYWQLGVGIAAAVVGAAAAVATAWAAWAATIAAKAAVAASSSERAWLTQDGIDGHVSSNITINGVLYPTGFVVALRWNNTGRSPALRASIYVDHRIVAPNDPVPTFVPAPPTDEIFGVLGPGRGGKSEPRAINGTLFERVKRGEVKWYLYSKATYVSAFAPGQICESEACGIIAYHGDRQMEPGGPIYPVISLSLLGPQNTAT